MGRTARFLRSGTARTRVRLVLTLIFALAVMMPALALSSEPALAHGCQLYAGTPTDQGSYVSGYASAQCYSGFHRLRMTLIKSGYGTVGELVADFHSSASGYPSGCAGSGYYYTYASLVSLDHQGFPQTASSPSRYIVC